MSAYSELQNELRASPKTWLVTGVGGFIGSHLLEELLRLGQKVVGLDNFSTGRKANLEQVRAAVGEPSWSRFGFMEADARDPDACAEACRGVDFVLHQAALGSVPGSIADPAGAHASNVTGFLNVLQAGRQAGVRRVVYASSSAVYGDDPRLPKLEGEIGNQLSPYAATKLADEIYAGVWARVYGLQSVGLRYFNVFGPRQDPEGAYAAVIPKWIAALLKCQPIYINGDGETTRDFCFVANVVQANLLAATNIKPETVGAAFNIALGRRTTLNELFGHLQEAVRRLNPELPEQKPIYRDFRSGDIRHSVADISKARGLLGYEPTHQISEGLELSMAWYRGQARVAE